MFVAYPPKRSATMTEASGVGLAAATLDGGDRSRELETVIAQMTAAREDLMRRLQDKDVDIARLAARASVAEGSVARLTSELATAQARAGDAHELLSVKQLLLETQRRERTVMADLEVANSLISSLKAEVQVLKGGNTGPAQAQAAQKIEQLQGDVQRLRDQLMAQADAMTSPAASGPSTSVRSLISAIGPMLWGLEQSVGYLEQFAGNEPTLAQHVKQLGLLQKVLKRLVDESV